jgi:hypothetical protein
VQKPLPPAPPPPAAIIRRDSRLLRPSGSARDTVRTSLAPPPPPLLRDDPPPLNPPAQATTLLEHGPPGPPGVGAPPTATYSVCPGVTARSPMTRAPRPGVEGTPAVSLGAPGAPVASTCRVVTPAGTSNGCSPPVKPKVTVVGAGAWAATGGATAPGASARPRAASAVRRGRSPPWVVPRRISCLMGAASPWPAGYLPRSGAPGPAARVYSAPGPARRPRRP